MSPPAAVADGRAGPARAPTAPRRRPRGPVRERRTGEARPRRVSGPAGPRSAPGTGSAGLLAALLALPASAARGVAALPGATVRATVALPGSAARGALALPGLSVRALGALPDHPLVIRLLRGRWWIAVVAFALMGIVAMQVAMLKLNAGFTRATERSAELQRDDARLAASVARLDSVARIQAEGRRLGLVMPPAGEFSYLHADPQGDVGAALRIMRAPMLSADGSGAGSTNTGSSGSPSSSGSASSSGSGSSATSGSQSAAPASDTTTTSSSGG